MKPHLLISRKSKTSLGVLLLALLAFNTLVTGPAVQTMALAAVNDTKPTCTEFKEMRFSGETPNKDKITLKGVLAVDNTTCELTGKVTAGFGDGSQVTVQAADGTITMFTGDIAIEIGDGMVLVDGEPISVEDSLDILADDLSSSADPAFWSPLSRANMALVAITSTPEWNCNVALARSKEVFAICINWCRVAAYAAATAIVAAATAGCAALLAGCAVGTSITFGGIAVPCVVLIGLCAGGVFAGAAAAYEAVLALWNP
jgi:hypothetical protein